MTELTPPDDRSAEEPSYDLEEIYNAYYKLSGVPAEPDKPGEKGKFATFIEAAVDWFKPLAESLRELFLLFSKSSAEKRIAEADAIRADSENKTTLTRSAAQKQAEEAANIAEERRLKRLERGREAITDIFAKEEPLAAKQLKLDLLAESFPELKQQIAKIQSVIDDLSQQHGAEVVISDPKLLPESEEEAGDG